MDEALQRGIERATVAIFMDEADETPSGSGFVVAGNFILTAACCVPHEYEDPDNPFATGHPVTILAYTGKRLKAEIRAIDLISDIAVIGPPRDENDEDATAEYEAFTRATDVFVVCDHEYSFGEKIPARVLGTDREWIDGIAQQWCPGASLMSFESVKPISPSMAGSPILNEDSHVIAVMAGSTEKDGPFQDSVSSGAHARPCQALPFWVLRTIKAAEPARIQRGIDAKQVAQQ